MADIDKLLEGFQRFRKRYFETDRALYQRLTQQGQSPKTLMIGCSDSRVDPAIITDTDPGDLFVVRNVANLVPPCDTGGAYHGTSAALEFAVCHLKVANIVVLGHARCGGIKALLESEGSVPPNQGFIAPWVNMAARARDRVLGRWPEAGKEFQQRACERASILVSLDNLMTFSFVSQRAEAGQLQLYGWYFDLENGELMQYDPQTGRFHDLYDRLRGDL